MKLSNATRLTYQWGLPSATLVVLVAAAVRMPQHAWNGTHVIAVTLWMLLIAMSEAWPIPLPRSESKLRLTLVFEFGALLCFATVPAALIVGLGRLCGDRLLRVRPGETLFTAARAMLVIGVTGTVLFQQDATAGVVFANESILPRATALAMIVFALVRAGVEAWAAAAGPRVPEGTTASMTLREQLLLSVVALPFGAAFAWVEATSGPAVAGCALLMVILSRGIERAPLHAAAEPVTIPTPGAESRIATVRMLMSAIDAFDPFTRGHSDRIARASVRVARHLALSPEAMVDLEYAALLHDIGRTAIHLDVLTRPGTLTGQERAVLQTHPTVGYDIIHLIPDLGGAATIVHAHHEQPDGRGYPRGLKGQDIPIGARIIMVVAAFDAMTRERPYRRGLPVSAACNELRRHAGTQFFPEVVEAFVALLHAGEIESGPEGDDLTASSPPSEDASFEHRAA